MNKVILLGRLTKDPEIRYSNTGMAIATFTIAIDRPPKKDGTKEADFINCTAFQKLAELVGNYFQKGRKMLLEGRIQTRNYENKEGKKVYVTEVVASNIEFADSKPEQQAPTVIGADVNNGKSQTAYANPQQQYAQPNSNNQPGFNQFGSQVSFDEVVPF